MDANHWNPFHTEFCLFRCGTKIFERFLGANGQDVRIKVGIMTILEYTGVNAERASSLSHQGTIGVLWPQEWYWQDNINGRDHREMPLPKNSEGSSGWWRNLCCGSEPTLINNHILITNLVEWDCVQITLKSGLRCASLICITWISCIAFVTFVTCITCTTEIDYH